MKKTLSILLILLSANTFASNSVTISGEEAKELMNALYRSGVELKQNSTSVETKLEKSIICHGSREEALTGGILSDEECFAGQKLLANSSALAQTLRDSGAGVDGAMGKWYTYASNIKCSLAKKTSKVKCSFKVE